MDQPSNGMTGLWRTHCGNPSLTHNFVSMASFCMISMMVLQAFEQQSGLAKTVMGFSDAPAFSFLWMSILERRKEVPSAYVIEYQQLGKRIDAVH